MSDVSLAISSRTNFLWLLGQIKLFFFFFTKNKTVPDCASNYWALFMCLRQKIFVFWQNSEVKGTFSWQNSAQCKKRKKTSVQSWAVVASVITSANSSVSLRIDSMWHRNMAPQSIFTLQREMVNAVFITPERPVVLYQTVPPQPQC